MVKATKRWKKIGFILVIALIVSMVPILSMAGQGKSTEPGTSAGQIGSYVDVYGENGDKSGKYGENADNSDKYGEKTGEEYPTSVLTDTSIKNDLYVNYSKEIEPTKTENEFKINLNVTTNDTREEYKANAPTDLVVIMDVSGSMDQKYNSNDKTRWEEYCPALIEFINTFMDANPDNQISIIAFSGNGKSETVKELSSYYPTVHYNLTQGFVDNAEDAIKSFYDKDTNFTYPTNYLGQTATSIRQQMMIGLKKDLGIGKGLGSYTNAQAGFRGGHEAIEFDYTANENATILFVSDGVPNEAYEEVTNNSNVSDGTYSVVSSTKNYAVDKAVSECGVMMEAFENAYDNSKLYTFAVGTEASNGTNSPMMNSQYVEKCFVTTDLNIAETFNDIAYELTHSVKLWTVTDPMSEWVTFKDFAADENGKKTNDGGLATEDGGVITWELAEKTKNADGTYTYSISYYVTLDTNHPDFVEDEYYPTNKETTLDYSFSYNNGSEISDQTSLFRIPTVKGIKPKETFSFNKEVKGEGFSTNDEFTFLVSVDNNSNFEYRIGDGGPQQSNGNGTITIEAGQTVYIDNLPVYTKVKVSEIGMPSFYTPVEKNKEMTITKDVENTMTFTNNYAKSEVNVTKEGNRNGKDETVWHGNDIVYTLTVSNDGDMTAEGIAIRDAIPEFTTFEKIITDNDDNITGDYNSDKGYVHWFVKELAVEESVELKFSVTVDEDFTWDDEINNQATYSYTGKTSPEAINFDNDFEDDTEIVTHIPPQPGMEIEKSNNPKVDTKLSRGDIITYTIKVSSTGTPNLKNVWVKDYIPAGTTYVAGSAESNNGSYNEAGYVEWNIDEIEDSIELTFQVKVNDDAVDGQEIKNVALVDHTGYDERGDKEDPTTETNPVYNYVEVPVVAGEEATPAATTTGGDDDSTVLGEEAANDEDGSVLGEEAKTGDVMNMTPLLIFLAIMMLVVFIVAIQAKRKNN